MASGENEILKRVLPLLPQSGEVVLPPGDDCAALESGIPGKLLLAAADQVIEKVHYWEDTPPGQVAEKLLKRNLSDIAAMGGIPKFALLTLALRKTGSDNWCDAFFQALSACARRYNVAVIGGDLAGFPAGDESSCNVASLTILGEVASKHLCRRDALQHGEILAVTGALGNTLDTEHHLHFEPRLAEGQFLAEQGFTRAMMDISDGLAMDLPRMGRLSHCGFRLDLEALPQRDQNTTLRQAMCDGEDYELLFSVAEARWAELRQRWPFDTPLHAIGRVDHTLPDGFVGDKDGNFWCREEENAFGKVDGYEHF